MKNEPKFKVGKKIKFNGEKHKIVAIKEENGSYRYFFDEYQEFYRGGYSMPHTEFQLSALESEISHA